MREMPFRGTASDASADILSGGETAFAVYRADTVETDETRENLPSRIAGCSGKNTAPVSVGRREMALADVLPTTWDWAKLFKC